LESSSGWTNTFDGDDVIWLISKSVLMLHIELASRSIHMLLWTVKLKAMDLVWIVSSVLSALTIHNT
jgi:hypothetical protein